MVLGHESALVADSELFISLLKESEFVVCSSRRGPLLPASSMLLRSTSTSQEPDSYLAKALHPKREGREHLDAMIFA